MDYRCVTILNEDLANIIDASIPNKSQNQAVKLQVNRACDQLMNRIADGWLTSKLEESQGIDVKKMVDRFLSWKLPEDFHPDGGISFKKMRNENTPYPTKNEPVGTNLFDADQAESMIRYLLASN